QKERWLKPFASGDKLGCFGLTEPQAGSDAAEQRTTAVRRGDRYVINGTKNWITNGPVADAIVLFTMTDLSQGTKGITAFVVDTGTPGFLAQKADEKLGICASPSCTIFFENMEVPLENRLGREGEGFKIAMSTLAGVRHSRESSMAKLYASEAANRVADKAVQIHGGMGYSKELDVERHFRDARITEIYEGTSEIQRMVISNAILK